MISHLHLQIVATVLKLGNLNFVPVTNMDGTEGCRIENEYELYDVGELVKVEVDSLRSALLARWPCRLLQCWDPSKLFLFNIQHLYDPSFKTRPEKFKKSFKTTAPKWWKMAKTLHRSVAAGAESLVSDLSANEAAVARDALCRTMYSRWEKKIRKEKNINKNVLQAFHTHRRQDQRGHQGDQFFMASRMFVMMKLAPRCWLLCWYTLIWGRVNV